MGLIKYTPQKTGVLFVGLNGATASTTVAGAIAMSQGTVPPGYCVTGLPPISNLPLLNPEQIVFSGWDYVGDDLATTAKRQNILSPNLIESISSELSIIKPMRGLHTALDIPREQQHDNIFVVTDIFEAVNQIKDSISEFKREYQLNCVIIVNLGSPQRRSSKPLSSLDESAISDLLSQYHPDEIPSSFIYALAAIESGVHFIDFTPSELLESPGLLDRACDTGSQLAGRDGSTGQTMLKMVIADLLRMRNLRLHSWFSTNILGNHDGYVLSMPDHCETKIHDKTSVLSPLLKYNDFEHLVKINHFKSRGDNKESWDVIDFSGWLGINMSLRMNWHGADSILAAPLILDLVRLMEYGDRANLCGFQPQYAFYFKHPFQRLGTSLNDQYRELIEFYDNR